MDLSWLVHWLDSANTFFQFIWDFMGTGIYQFFKDALVIITKALIYSYLQFKILMLDIAVTVVKEISEESGVTALVKSAWGSIPGDIQSTLAFFKIPQGLTLIFSAIPARWAMKFVPGVN
ncbi:hypothetical protein ALP53_200020 [Pseudomonas savastanoi pv. phaseolicola]|nr:hypothetical protein ALP53_200020 [Pseudomonas savastanoi pv. phaseolicola]